MHQLRHATAFGHIGRHRQMWALFQNIFDKTDQAARAHLDKCAKAFGMHVFNQLTKAHGLHQVLKRQLLLVCRCCREHGTGGRRPHRNRRFEQFGFSIKIAVLLHVCGKHRRMKARNKRQLLTQYIFIQQALGSGFYGRLLAAEDDLMRAIVM